MISEEELNALETEFNPIPSYRSLVHRLCAEIRRLRAEIDRLRAMLDDHVSTGRDDDDEDDGR